MTREEFNALLLAADREFAFQKRQFERFLDAKYNQTTVIGFLTEEARAENQSRLEASKEAERRKGLENIYDDVEAKFFGTRGRKGLEKTLPPVVPTPQIISTNPNQLISLTHLINNYERSKK